MASASRLRGVGGVRRHGSHGLTGRCSLASRLFALACVLFLAAAGGAGFWLSADTSARALVAGSEDAAGRSLRPTDLLKAVADDYVERAGGQEQVAGALALGGACGSLLLIPGAPRMDVGGVPLVGPVAPLAGSLFAAWCIQLPEGELYGDLCRKASRRVVSCWDALTRKQERPSPKPS
ncbi:unnamed protein product [Polarella glacialis]|uniref:Uncharacterized protein n=1 Tax=Polarella glacialis TaxID=89957 RepID=A0A813HPZ0_POLGL|nr:unnamed protein product [Polarella glacialis]